MNKNLLLTKVNEYIFDDKELNLSIKNAQKIGSCCGLTMLEFIV